MANLRQFIGSKLRQYSWGDRAKFTGPYDLFLSLVRPARWDTLQRRKEHLRKLLPDKGSGLLIFDIGANNGSKADLYRRLGARVICVEPDRRNIELLEERFRFCKNVIIVPKAIGDQPGQATFHVLTPGSAYNTLSTKQKATIESQSNRHFGQGQSFEDHYQVEVTTIDFLIEHYGVPDFLKLDVEGYEALAFKGLSHPVPFVEFEANLPEFKSEALECIDKLASLNPGVRFAYSTSGEIDTSIEDWSPHEAFRRFVSETGLRYLEIIARLDH